MKAERIAFGFFMEKIMLKTALYLFLLLVSSGCAPLSSNVKRYNPAPRLSTVQTNKTTVKNDIQKIDTSEVIKTAVGCRYYQTDVIIPGIKTEKPVKFVQVLAADLHQAKKTDSRAVLRCRRNGNDMIYTIRRVNAADRGFSFGYKDGKLILNGIATENTVYPCANANKCASELLTKTALDL